MKILNKIKYICKYSIAKTIEFIEYLENYKVDVTDKKFISSKDINLYVMSDKGYVKAKKIFKTKPYQVYKIVFCNNTYLECADEHILFDKNFNEVFAKDLNTGDIVIGKDGYIMIKEIIKYPWKFCMYDLSVDSNEHRYFTNNILSHNTTSIGAYFCWYMLFHQDRNCVVVSNKGKTSTEILTKIKEFFEGLPFFLKPGVIRLAQTTLTLENGCYLMCATTNATSITGQSAHLILVDEAAHVPENLMDAFWRSVYPTMSSSRLSQIIMCSTPKGKHNLFYKIYNGAVTGTNNFKYYRVDWWQVPGHDEAWAAEQKKDFGEENFAQEFGLQFDTDASRLINANAFKLMHRIKKEYKSVDLANIPKSISDKILWHPNFDPTRLTMSELQNSRFVLMVDTAEGMDAGESGKKDSDWNIINIFKVDYLSPIQLLRNRNGISSITDKDLFRFIQVGIYMDNDRDEEMSAEAAKHIVFNTFKCGHGEIDNCRIMLEMNFNGKNFVTIFKTHPNYYDSIFLKTYHNNATTGEKSLKKIGFKAKGGKNGKGYWMEMGAKMLKQNQIIISQWDENINKCSISELENFTKQPNGSYAGSACHDDIAVTILYLSLLNNCDEFLYWFQDWFDKIPANPKKTAVCLLMKKYIEENPNQMSDQDFQDLYLSGDSNSSYMNNIISSNSNKSNSYIPPSYRYKMNQGY